MKIKITTYRNSHFLTYYCFFIFLFFASTQMLAQVGINTTNPDASSILDISSSDKGLLVPRVSLSNVTLTSLDGSNTAANGLLIWNTNASTTGGAGIGYYYFNGTTWEKITTNNTATNDNDWFEEGTTTAPNAITDDIFTEGNVAIGKNTADYNLDIYDNTGVRGINVWLEGSTNATIYGNYIRNSNTANGTHYGTFQQVDGNGTGIKYGLYNQVTNNNSTGYGIYNSLSGT